MGISSFVSVLFVLYCLCEESTATGVTPNPTLGSPKLEKIVVVARHGTRTPKTFAEDEQRTALTPQGKLQLAQLGKFLRRRYDGFIPTRYNDTMIKPRSASSDRCRQSSASMLRALFPNPMDFPLNDYTPTEVDYTLRTTTWPTLQMFGSTQQFQHVNQTAWRVLSNDTIQKLNQVMGVGPNGTLCESNLGACVVVAQDIARCSLANQQPCHPFLCETLLPTLDKLRAHFAHFFAYTGDERYQEHIGTFGFKLIEEIVAELSAHPHARMHSYVIQQPTIIGFFSTLALLNDEDYEGRWNLPRFGEVIIMELYSNGEVRFLNGSPPYDNVAPLPMQCSRSADRYPNTTTCSFHEWSRFMLSRGPKSPSGVCYVNEKLLEQNNCVTHDAPQAGTVCSKFRAACPREACPKDSIANSHNLSCVPYSHIVGLSVIRNTPTESSDSFFTSEMSWSLVYVLVLAIVALGIYVWVLHKKSPTLTQTSQRNGGGVKLPTSYSTFS